MRLQSLRARKANETLLVPVKPTKPTLFFLLVPVYRELDNGNLTRLFEVLRAQTSGLDRLRVLFLVNNTAEVAANPADPVFQENQRSIRWLEEKRAELPFPIEVIDLSTKGVVKKMAVVRQAGLDWMERSVEAEELERAVVVHLDADTYLPPHFLNRTGALYEMYGELETVFFVRDYEIRGEPTLDLLFTHNNYRMRKALFDFRNTWDNLRFGMASYQISARWRAHKRFGGFPVVDGHEDTVLTELLVEHSVWTQTAEIEMRTEDRTRTSGFNSLKRGQALEKEVKAGGRSPWRLFRRLTPREALVQQRPEEKEFYLNHSLFHELAHPFWAAVRAGRKTYAAAVAEYQERLEKFVGRKIRRQRSRYFYFSPARLQGMPEITPVPFSGGSILSPVAHPFSRFVVAGTERPAQELWNLVMPHCDDDEKRLAEKALAREAAVHDGLAKARCQSLLAYFRGEEAADPLVRGLVAAGPWLPELRASVQKGALKPESGVLEMQAGLPDWFAPFVQSGATREASMAKILTALSVRARARPETSGLEKAMTAIFMRKEQAEASL